MRRGTLFMLAALSLVARPAPAAAQFAYPVDQSAVTVTRDQPYADGLAMDVYRPARSSGARLPVLIFSNGATGADRAGQFYDGWARAAAAHGFAAVLADLHREALGHDLRALLTHVTSNAGALGVDADAIAVYCGSGNVWSTLPLLEQPGVPVKAAVAYYGAADVSTFRRDLPVLFVRAGLDRPSNNKEIDRLVASALAENAPVAVLNDPGGYHAFEVRNDDAVTRDVIEQTLAYLTRVLAPAYQAALRAGIVEAAAAADAANGRFGKAAASYAELVRARPQDLTLSLAYGEALLGDRQYDAACRHFEVLRDKDLGPRDRGLPAARACMLAGDSDRAVGWLATIPRRFLPDSVETDEAFAPIRARADFKAVFARDPQAQE